MRLFTVLAFIGCAFLIAGDLSAQRPQQNKGKGVGQKQRGQQGQQGKQRGQMDPAQMLEGVFQKLDQDSSGTISMNEAPDRMKDKFAAIDANSDNNISKEELRNAFSKMRQRGNQGGQGADGQKRMRGQGQQGQGGKGQGANKDGKGQKMDVAMLIKKADKNNDGAISIDEAPDRMKQRFDQIDADGSGSISAEELKAAIAKMGGRDKGAAKGDKGQNKGGADKNLQGQKPKRPGSNIEF